MSKTFLSVFFDRNQGFAHLHVRVIIAHLFTEYGHVEYQDLVGNFSKLSDMWDANQNFQELAKPAQEIQEFVNDGS